MNALPRLLYILQTIPILIPPSFFKTYQSACSKFLWGTHKPRISFKQLTRPKHLGGIGLPNIFNYYTATHLTRIVDWKTHSRHKVWVALEASLTTLSLASLPWTNPRHIPLTLLTNPLIGPTLKCFPKACSQLNLSSIPSPLTPVKLNPDFPPGMHNHFLTDNFPQDNVRAHQFFHQGKILTASQISTQTGKSPISPWTYTLLAHYLQSLDKHSKCSRPLTPFETLCSQVNAQPHLISNTHNLLFTDDQTNQNLGCQKWEKDLSISPSAMQWEQSFLNIHKGSRKVTTQENSYKIVSRWYRTPTLLHKITPETSAIFWRCLADEGTRLHIWWSCTSIQTYWKEIHSNNQTHTPEAVSSIYGSLNPYQNRFTTFHSIHPED